jgi:hypothetical protein
MSDNPNDKWPPDSQGQNQSGQQPYQQGQQQPPTPGQVYYPPGYQQPPQGYQQPPPGYQQPPPGYQQPPGPYNQQAPFNQYGQQNQADASSGSGVWGWVIFLLIFGVGNLILYSTTGWFIIPIPRR